MDEITFRLPKVNSQISIVIRINFLLVLTFFILIGIKGQGQAFSANLLPNQTFTRPTPGPSVCGSSSFGTFITVSPGFNAFSYATQSFTVLTPGEVIIEVTVAGTNIGDPMLLVYNRFDPINPIQDFRVGDDDSGVGTRPRIACQNFFTPGTYTIVVTTYSPGAASGVVSFNVEGAAPVVILPTVTTAESTSITSGSANVGGAVIDDGGADVTERGVAWGTENNPTAGTVMGAGLGAFSETISGLSPGTTYYHRAYAVNSVGTAYGPQLTFTTLSAPLNPTSISATDIDICLGGSVELSAIGAEGEVYWYTGGCGEDFIATGNTISVSPTETTSYFARNFNNDLFSVGCASIEITIVDQPTPPDISRNPDFDQICEGQIISIIASLGQGGGGVAIDQYSFSIDDGLNWSEWSLDEPSFEAALGINLIRAHRITTASGCNNSEIVPVSWEVFEQPSAPELTRVPNNDVICYNATLTAQATSGSGGIGDIQDQYRYSTDNGVSWSEWSGEVPEFIGAEGVNILQSRRIADGVGCNTAVEEVSWVMLPELMAPVVSENQIICHNSIPQPLTATEAAGGHNSGYSYQWQWSQDGETWADLTDETSLVFTPGILDTTTHFRLQTTENATTNCAQGFFSNVVTIEVLQEINPGLISILNDLPATICSDNEGVMIFGTEDYSASYMWELGTSGPDGDFELLPANEGPWLVLPALLQTTWVRRITTIGSNGNLCNSEPSNILEITVQAPVQSGNIDGNQFVCYGDTPAMIVDAQSGVGSGTISYIWESSSTGGSEGYGFFEGVESATLQLGQLTNALWVRRTTVSTQNGVSCQSTPTEPVFIGVHEPIEILNIDVENVYCRRIDDGGAIFFDLGGGVSPPVDYLWSSGQTSPFLQGVQQGNYSILVTDNNGCILEESFEIGLDDDDCILRIPQGFSPNGDGLNDVWAIRNFLYLHPQNLVKIFDRKGTLVFEAQGYDDNWDGTPNRGNVLVNQNGKVPSGVYFYLIWENADSNPISGSVYVSN